MHFELLPYFLIKSSGIGVGIFIGLLIGLGVRAKGGNREGLIMNSVVVTALVVGLAALVFTALIRMVSYSG
ncbi:hypothetical protein [Celeribacter ethanolicus]|uniref:Uncharacterized protein n=1 Tax=Celeribacter ethanolicus TaxID=1758178 RepID=A0A291G7L9_9RHOB|nr:hypothetical protein [Celeribacter ethanolicus]ATG46409.1 hypothetical protein CEW89_01795 [Celeribacter ethanolicus]TNE69698.1 MAG: hypothetical protein EP336_01680 [Paracoccaceae bacterium]